jgi:hypothetical protein
VTWVDPELADGVEDALTLFELDVPFEVEPELPVPAELPDVAFDDVELLVPVAALLDAEVEPGRVKATTPAVTSPAAPTETVAARSLARPRRRAATAGRVSSLRLLMKSPLLASDRMSLAPRLVPGLGGTSDRPLNVAASAVPDLAGPPRCGSWNWRSGASLAARGSWWASC